MKGRPSFQAPQDTMSIWSFGLCNTPPPSVFQAFVNDVFWNKLQRFIIIYIDDILVNSYTMEQHCEGVPLDVATYTHTRTHTCSFFHTFLTTHLICRRCVARWGLLEWVVLRVQTQGALPRAAKNCDFQTEATLRQLC